MPPYSNAKTRKGLNWVDVFQHHADDVEDLRRHIAENVRKNLESGFPLLEPDPQLRLYCGYYKAKNNVSANLGGLIWKHSEQTGKYIGCQYWSVLAKALFDKEFSQHKKKRTLASAWGLADSLKKKSRGKMQLVHEHVFPRKALRDKLLSESQKNVSLQRIEELMNLLAVGCVVLEAEHPSHNDSEGDCNNPWLRYKGKLLLADNSNWPPFQRKLIEEAGLLNPPTLVLKTGN